MRTQGLWEEHSNIGSNIYKVTAVGGNLVLLETEKCGMPSKKKKRCIQGRRCLEKGVRGQIMKDLCHVS